MKDGAKQALNDAVTRAQREELFFYTVVMAERCSTPGSKRYLRHLTWAEVGDVWRPAKAGWVPPLRRLPVAAGLVGHLPA
eukprot:gene43620-54472_t